MGKEVGSLEKKVSISTLFRILWDQEKEEEDFEQTLKKYELEQWKKKELIKSNSYINKVEKLLKKESNHKTQRRSNTKTNSKITTKYNTKANSKIIDKEKYKDSNKSEKSR